MNSKAFFLLALFTATGCAKNAEHETQVALAPSSTESSAVSAAVVFPVNKEKLITIDWAHEPSRPDLYEGANYPNPHEAKLEFWINNNSLKDIDGFKGKLSFINLFDKEIYALKFESDITIEAGKRESWSGTVNTASDPSADKLYNSDFRKIKLVMEPELILFVDGSQWSPESGMSAPDPVKAREPTVENRPFNVYAAVVGTALYVCEVPLQTAFQLRADGDLSGSSASLASARKTFADLEGDHYSEIIQVAAGRKELTAALVRLHEVASQYCSQALPKTGVTRENYADYKIELKLKQGEYQKARKDLFVVLGQPGLL